MTSTSIYPSVIPVSQSKTEIYINKAKLVHGDLYDYSLVEYIHSHIKIQIKCDTHGIFWQLPSKHLRGHGCRNCGILIHNKSLTSNTEDFIQKAKNIHGEKYDYSLVEYKNARAKIKIICKLHGIFEQSPRHHTNGHGCDKCSNRISKPSIEWLKSLNIQDLIEEYKLPEHLYKPVDGYSPSTNTVYQFHGDYWHGNPVKYNGEDINPTRKISYGELYRKTIESDLWILSLGYNLVTMWESGF